MADEYRKRGGDSNKRGNRFEDSFATFLLVRSAPKHFMEGEKIRLKEQAGCPVDDFVLEEPKMNRYHQLKADKSITWGEATGKLEREFVAQKAECEKRKETFALIVVVADEDRKTSLNNNMPKDLAGCTSVFLFPLLDKPSALALRKDLLEDTLENISAARISSLTEQQHIVRAFHLG